MAQQLINIGASPNDGTGTPLRTSFDYTNQNFTELYAASGLGASSNTQVLFNDSGVINGDAGMTYVKATDTLTVAGNIVMSVAGKGIDFTATANSSGNLQTSELLADYEEGTWVPTDASGAGLTFTTVSACRYTKIGRAVTIQGIITYPSTANTATALIAGLPFAYADFFPVNITYIGSTLASYILGVAGSNFYIFNNTGTPLTNANLTGATVYFGGTYMT
jgi:hypothetical protein